jgi:hypothetical protein
MLCVGMLLGAVKVLVWFTTSTVLVVCPATDGREDILHGRHLHPA